MKKHIIVTSVIILFLITLVLIFAHFSKSELNFSGTNNPAIDINNTLKSDITKPDDIQLESGTFSVLFYDFATEKEITINPEEEYYMASIFKVPVAVSTLLQIDQGKINLDDKVTLLEEDLTGGDGSLQYEPIGTEYTVSELLFYLLKNSDNVAMNMLIRITHIDQAFLTALELKTSFDFANFNNGTVFDGKNLFLSIEQNQLLKAESKQLLYSLMQDTSFEDRIAIGLEPDSVLIHKIGTWPETSSYHDCGIIIRKDNNKYILCVLTKDTSFSDASNLSASLAKYFEQTY